MSGANASTKTTGETATAELRSERLLTDENWKIFEAFTKLAWEVTNFYAKGIAFFLAVNAAVFGYILKADLGVGIRNAVSIFGLVTAACFLLCSVAFFLYVFGIMRTIQTSVLSGNVDAVQRYGMPRNLNRTRILVGTFAFGSITLITLMLTGYIVVLV